MYKFAQFDPRPISAATEANDGVFAQGAVLGIEVTVPGLAERCHLGNIDPQHTDGDDVAAIEVALEIKLPTGNAILATIRADLDSMGAMAVLAIREDYEWARTVDPNSPIGQICLYGSPPFERGSEEMDRLEMVAQADRFAKGGWPGRRPLPTTSNPWPEEEASAESYRPLAAIAACLADFKVAIAERVAAMVRWLLSGNEPEEYREWVEAERVEMISAIEDGTISVHEVADGRVAAVASTHRAATMVGYSIAPVVVALNPEFRFQGGEPHCKFTICQFEVGYVDLRAAFGELNELEQAEGNWGGSPTIGGSPQGVSSILTIEQVVEVIEQHLTR